MNKLTKKLSILFASVAMAAGVGLVGGANSSVAKADDIVYKSSIFSASNNAKRNSNYTSTVDNTTDGFSVTVANGNNNNNNWSGHFRFGQKNAASKGSVTTKSPIDKAISKVSLAIGPKCNKVNGIYVYANTTNTFDAENKVGTFTGYTTNTTITADLTGTSENMYYKVEFDMAAGANGNLDIGQIDFIVSEASKTLTGVTITPPTKLTGYKEGDSLDTTGFKVEEKYDDASVVDITSDTSKYSVTPALTTALSAGDNTFTVTYTADESIAVTGGTFTATAIARVITSIAVNKLPTKVRYKIGESFDATGLELTATYSDGETATITSGFTTSGFDSETKGTKTITVDYNGVTATFEVTVVELTGIKITSLPTKTYYQGDTFSTSDIEVVGVYSDEVEETIDSTKLSSDVTTFDTIGTQTITISYESYTASFEVTIVKKPSTATATWTKADSIEAYGTASGGALDVTFADGNLSMLGAKGSGSTPFRPWSDGIRVYAGNTLTITPNNGVIITEFVIPTISFSTLPDGVTKNGTTYTVTSGGDAPIVLSGASKGTISADITITYMIPERTVTGVELSASELVFENRNAEAQTLTATVLPTGATNKNVTWSVTGDAVTVNEGVVTPVKAGTATVTVTTEEGEFTASCSVIVNKDLGVTINPSITDTQLKIGQTVQLNYELTGLDKDTVTSPTVTWETVSGNENVLSVNTSGLVTAMGVGTDSIKVTIDNEVSATIEYEVLNDIVAVESVKISIPDGASTTLKTGVTLQLTATVNPSNATNQEVVWSTTDEEIASVSATGLVTAGTKSGTATITVVSDADTAIKDTMVITVNNPVEGVTLNKNELSLTAGNSEQLVASITPEYATNKNVTWSSSKPTVADVDQNGNVTAKDKAGTAVITVTTTDGNFSAECTVTVTKESGYILVTDASTIKAGDIIRLGASTSSKSYAAGAISVGNKYMSTTAATITDGKLVSDNAIDLVVGGEEGAWTLSYNGELLCATAPKSVIFGDGTSGTSTWTISIDASGNATISSTTSSYGRLLVNVSATRVVNYATSTATSATMLLPQIYRQTAALNNDEAFVKAVNDIGTVTIDSGTAIENAKTLYAKLDAEDLALESVITAKATLDAKEAEYNALVADKVAADAVVSKIDAIGEVTKDNYESKITAIEEAEAAYANLTDSQKSFVTNYSTLTAARNTYDEISSAKNKANEVIDLINAIGDVTMDNFSGKITAIEKAETAYAGLTDLQKEFVTNYSTLTSARASYDSYSQVQDVIDSINAIGEITKDNYVSKLTEIEAAEEAYAKLTAEQDKLVTNYDVLAAARNRHDALVAAKSEADTLIGFINEYNVDTITYNDKGHIEALRALYEEHKGTDVDLFITAEHIAKIEALEARMTKLTNAHDFVVEWSQMRTNGGETGICGYLTDSENSTLVVLLNKFAAFDTETQTLIRAETDVIYGETTVTIGETMDYMASVRDWVKNIVSPTSSELNGIVLTTNTESNSLVALFAIVGLVAVSAYYFLEKKKLSK